MWFENFRGLYKIIWTCFYKNRQIKIFFIADLTMIRTWVYHLLGKKRSSRAFLYYQISLLDKGLSVHHNTYLWCWSSWTNALSKISISSRQQPAFCCTFSTKSVCLDHSAAAAIEFLSYCACFGRQVIGTVGSHQYGAQCTILSPAKISSRCRVRSIKGKEKVLLSVWHFCDHMGNWGYSDCCFWIENF